VKELKYSKSR